MFFITQKSPMSTQIQDPVAEIKKAEEAAEKKLEEQSANFEEKLTKLKEE